MINSSLAMSVEDFNVGFINIDINSIETDNFKMGLLYPTNDSSKSVEFGPFKMNVAIGGSIQEGTFPLVIISHGSGGSSLGYRSIALALAKNGFIVGLPLHPKNNFEDNSSEGTIDNFVQRPKHITIVLDKLLSNKKISQSINHEKISVVGHSMGGFTALALAGGKADTSFMVDICSKNQQLSDAFCKAVKHGIIYPKQLETSYDKRIKAIVAMAP